MHPVLFKIGPVTIYTYGVLVFIGVMVGYFVSLKEARRVGIEDKTFSDIIFWSIIFSFVGARILYILVEFKAFLKDPLHIGLGRSGFVFYGGLIGGILTFIFLSKKYNQNFLKLADVAAIGIPLGHSIGRLGCFFYGCCYGKPTEAFWGIRFPPDSPAGMLGTKVIPTQLISSFSLFAIFLILLGKRKKKRFEGEIFLTYLIIYGSFRFFIEFLRGDERGYIGMFSVSQFISLVVVAISLIFLWHFRKKLN